MKNLYLLTVCLLYVLNYSAQNDTLKKKKVVFVLEKDSSVLFQSKRFNVDDTSNEHKLTIEAYVSTYYSTYTEDNKTDYVKYPTMAARNNQFGLNMAMFSMNYKSKKLHSTLSLHYGDIAESVWPQKFNMIQEANVGVELVKNLWLDAGVFRSHIGVESTQPRENITSSMSLVNYFEPYFFSGAKLTYLLGSKLSLQLNAFNSFSSIIETNKNKLFGASCVYTPNDNLTITYNFITGDDTPDSALTKHQRYYHNLYATYQKKKWSIAAEANYGIQEYSKRIDVNTVNTAYMNSALIVCKHQTFKKIAPYARLEWFSDEDEMLSSGSNMGKYTWGATGGVEYKPLKNIAVSLEARQLNSDKPNFDYNGSLHNQRLEGIFCIDVWF